MQSVHPPRLHLYDLHNQTGLICSLEVRTAEGGKCGAVPANRKKGLLELVMLCYLNNSASYITLYILGGNVLRFTLRIYVIPIFVSVERISYKYHVSIKRFMADELRQEKGGNPIGDRENSGN